jgi:uncharacterized membrane protein
MKPILYVSLISKFNILDWVGVFLVGLVTVHIVIGAFILMWWEIWTLVRCVKGLLILNKGNAILNPNSWWFGE